MKEMKKSKSILKGAMFFLATFAFVGLFAAGTKFIKQNEVSQTNYETQVAYAEETFNIYYHNQSGEAYPWDTTGFPTQYTNSGITPLPQPTVEGREFVSWFTDIDCTHPVVQLEPADFPDGYGDIHLYGVFSFTSYLITCVVGGELYWQGNYTIDQSRNIPDVTVSSGFVPNYHVFAGWTGTDLTQPTTNLVISTGNTGNRSYVAQFIGETYNITYLDEYENALGYDVVMPTGHPQTHRFDQDTVLPVPTRAGYEFAGWYNENGVQVATIAANDTDYVADFKLYAHWTAKTNNVTYLDEGGNVFTGTFSNGQTTTFVYDQNSALIAPTKTGYDFAGWYTDPACTNRVYQIYAYTYPNDLTLYVKWTPAVYNITYLDEGGNAYSGNGWVANNHPTTHTYDTATDLVAPTRTGYTFVGWYTDEECTMPVNQVSAFTYTDNFYLYAKWSLNTYHISYLDQYDRAYTGSIAGLPTTYDYETQVDLPLPTRSGYDFVGWYVNSDCTEGYEVEYIPAHSVAQDITLYAKWTNEQYTVTLYANNGEQDHETVDVYYDTAYGVIADPTRQYYQFEGWYLDNETFTQRVYPETVYPYSEDSNLYAKWSLVNYTITLDVDGVISEVQITNQTPAFTIENPTKTGYTFAGWIRDDNNYGTNYNPFAYVLDNYTLTASFTPIEYTLRLTPDRALLDDHGDNAYNDHYYDWFDVDHNYNIETEDISLPNIDVEEYGLIFLGWTGEDLEEPTKDVVLEVGRIGNRAYTANFQGKEFTITLDASGGNVTPGQKTVEFSEAYGELPDPTFNAYDFKGWYDQEEGGNKINATDLYLLRENTTLYAHWELHEYTIQRVVNGITFIRKYNIESKTYNLPIPYLRGYDFLGWTSEGSEEPVRNISIKQGSTGDRVYEAQFELAIYTITTRILGESEKVEYTMLSDDITISPVEVEGYEFIGWSGTDLVIPAQTVTVEGGSVGNRVYIANLRAINYTLTLTVDGVDNEVEYNINSEDIAVPNPTKGGYIFKGWQDEETQELVKDLVAEQGSTGDKHYTAVFEKDNTDRNIAIGLFSAGGAVLAAGVAVGTVALVKKKKKF